MNKTTCIRVVNECYVDVLSIEKHWIGMDDVNVQNMHNCKYEHKKGVKVIA